MQEFLLILKGDGMNDMSPDELQNIMKDYQAWVAGLGENYLGGQRLGENGAMIDRESKELSTDGPFLESKEIIAGYYMIKATSQEEANRIALTSPHVGLYSIEIRPLMYPKM